MSCGVFVYWPVGLLQEPLPEAVVGRSCSVLLDVLDSAVGWYQMVAWHAQVHLEVHHQQEGEQDGGDTHPHYKSFFQFHPSAEHVDRDTRPHTLHLNITVAPFGRRFWLLARFWADLRGRRVLELGADDTIWPHLRSFFDWLRRTPRYYLLGLISRVIDRRSWSICFGDWFDALEEFGQVFGAVQEFPLQRCLINWPRLGRGELAGRLGAVVLVDVALGGGIFLARQLPVLPREYYRVFDSLLRVVSGTAGGAAVRVECSRLLGRSASCTWQPWVRRTLQIIPRLLLPDCVLEQDR